LLDLIVNDWNNWLAAPYGVEIRANVDEIPAISEKRMMLWEMADQSQDLTINERRAMKGYEPVAGGDVVPLLMKSPAPVSSIPPDLTAEDIKALAYGLDYKADGYQPTEAMAAEAERGLEWRREFNRGGTEVGVARARDISNRKNLSADTVKRMVSYFARHEVDKQGQGWSPGEKGYPSAGRIAWALWGGDPGRAWANKINRQLDDE
jgi:hypothetical protein